MYAKVCPKVCWVTIDHRPSPFDESELGMFYIKAALRLSYLDQISCTHAREHDLDLTAEMNGL